MGLFDSYYDPDEFGARAGLLGRLLPLRRAKAFCRISMPTRHRRRALPLRPPRCQGCAFHGWGKHKTCHRLMAWCNLWVRRTTT
jgi:hypothetical protein